MSFRLIRSSRHLLLRPRSQLPAALIARLITSTTPPPPSPPPPSNNVEKKPVINIEDTLAATKAYLEKVQLDMKPRIDPYIEKLNQASEHLKRLTSDVGDSKEALKRASKALNELTGYDQIDSVKQKVNDQALLFEVTRDQVQQAKRDYEQAIETRSNTQRGINELLQRKHLWTADDVTQFTELYRLEHSHSQAEMISKDAYQSCEKKMDREYMELARSIMERYHEEQLWSDKIRSVSTYGTWALMVVNLLLFVTVQTVFEPRKRKRLTDRFEELLISKVEEEEEKFRHVFESLDEKDKMLLQQQVAVMETLNSLVEHPLFDQETLVSLKEASKRNMYPVPISPVIPDVAVVDEPTVTKDDTLKVTVVDEPIVKKEDTSNVVVVDDDDDDDDEPVIKDNTLNDEDLSKLLLLTPANFDDAPFLKPTTTTTTISLSKTDLPQH
ncbi:Mdm33 family-domain-containing protein [Helicostylum pulchrum]|nr:Mdm33 family-domain-containing protein [Helicostylum pulchrum]